MAAIDGSDTAFLVGKLITELTVKKLPQIGYVDNKSLVDAVKSTKSVKDKRLRVDMSHRKHLVNEQKELQLYWIASSKQLADCLTKTTSKLGFISRILTAEKTSEPNGSTF